MIALSDCRSGTADPFVRRSARVRAPMGVPDGGDGGAAATSHSGIGIRDSSTTLIAIAGRRRASTDWLNKTGCGANISPVRRHIVRDASSGAILAEI